MTRPETPRAPAPPPLSEAQMEIMNVVWEQGESTVSAVWKAIAAQRPVARNTVQTMMVRLEEKGWLRCSAEGHAFRYRAVKPREDVLGGMVERLVDSAFGGSAEGLVLALLHGRGVTPTEVQRIRRMIDEAEQETKTRRAER
ncbi:MAG: BlaI/MecI/CopY family transcriptional regulator [Isosphaerales bacterium]